MGDGLLRTGDVARILGMSRQHIADLCDRGHIEHVRVGAHRRIPRSEMDRIARAELTREEATDLRLHQALLTPLLTNPADVIGQATRNLVRDTQLHGDNPPPHLTQWAAILASDLETIIDALVSPTPAARQLRTHSPFGGVLPESVRQQVLRCAQHPYSHQGPAASSAPADHAPTVQVQNRKP